MKGIARTYDHVTPAMQQQILQALEARWQAAVAGLTPGERATLFGWFPWMGAADYADQIAAPQMAIAGSSPDSV